MIRMIIFVMALLCFGCNASGFKHASWSKKSDAYIVLDLGSFVRSSEAEKLVGKNIAFDAIAVDAAPKFSGNGGFLMFQGLDKFKDGDKLMAVYPPSGISVSVKVKRKYHVFGTVMGVTKNTIIVADAILHPTK